jgi:SAM-dependent methyltransferase
MSINPRLEPFTALADVYKVSGLSAYGTTLAGQLLNFIYDMSWEGSRMLDLATGNGEVACWFAGRNIRAVGVDSSATMIKHAKALADEQNAAATFIQADIRTYQADQPADLVLCIGGSLNHLPTMNDLGAVFRSAAAACSPKKPFIFDLHTIRGLANAPAERIVSDGDHHLITARSAFSYETLSLNTLYTVFHYVAGWQRAEEMHTLRGYPVQAVQRLLNSSGFTLEKALTLDFAPMTASTEADMLLFVARRT